MGKFEREQNPEGNFYHCKIGTNKEIDLYTHKSAWAFITNLESHTRVELDIFINAVITNEKMPVEEIIILLLEDADDTIFGHRFLFKMIPKRAIDTPSDILKSTQYNNDASWAFCKATGIGVSMQIAVRGDSRITKEEVTQYAEKHQLEQTGISFGDDFNEPLNDVVVTDYLGPVDEIESNF